MSELLTQKQLDQVLAYVKANTTKRLPEYDDFISDNRSYDWKDWTPSYSAGGSMTYTSVLTNIARYKRFRDYVIFEARALGTTGGVAADNIRFTLPVVGKNITTAYNNFTCWIDDGGSSCGFATTNTGDGQTVAVYRYDGAVYGLGASRGFSISGLYEI